MKLTTVMMTALAVIATTAAAQDNPVLAKYGEYRFDGAHSLFHDGERVRDFTPEPPEQLGDRAMFSPQGRYLAFDFNNHLGGDGLYVYDVKRDRVRRYPAGEAKISTFDWIEYVDDAFVIYSTDFSSEEKPAMYVVDPHTCLPVFRGEDMAYGFPHVQGRGISYFRYASPDKPLRASLLSFDELFTGILFGVDWRSDEEREKDFYIMPPSKAKLSIETRHQEVLAALVTGDPETFAADVHPESGVRISLDARVSEEDLVFWRDQVRSAGTDTTALRMGTADGTGKPIYKTLGDHIRYLAGLNYENVEAIGYNRVIGRGNSINNVFDFFRDAIVVEYYWGGTEKYGDMDWHSLRLVYARGNDNWYVVGIVEDGWTI